MADAVVRVLDEVGLETIIVSKGPRAEDRTLTFEGGVRDSDRAIFCSDRGGDGCREASSTPTPGPTASTRSSALTDSLDLPTPACFCRSFAFPSSSSAPSSWLVGQFLDWGLACRGGWGGGHAAGGLAFRGCFMSWNFGVCLGLSPSVRVFVGVRVRFSRVVVILIVIILDTLPVVIAVVTFLVFVPVFDAL